MSPEPASNVVVDFQYYKDRKGESQPEDTGEDFASLSHRVNVLEKTIDEIHGTIGGPKASPENLYQSVGIDNAQTENSAILRIREVLQEGIGHLMNSLSIFDDEIARESHIDLYFNCIRRLPLYSVTNSKFIDAITALIIALKNHVIKTYSRNDIIALNKATKMLKDNFAMSEENLFRYIDLLEEAGFCLTIPMDGVDFYE